jgi:type IV pilus assembly protein PilB
MPLKKVINKHIGELLIDLGVINRQHLDKALAIQEERPNKLFGEILVEMGCAKEEDIAQALTVQYGFPYLPLASYEINPDIVGAIPRALAEKYALIPIDKIGNSLTLVMYNPLLEKAVEEAERVSGCNVQFFVSTLSDIRKAIAKYYK